MVTAVSGVYGLFLSAGLSPATVQRATTALCPGRPVLWASGPGPSDNAERFLSNRLYVNSARQTRLTLPFVTPGHLGL